MQKYGPLYAWTDEATPSESPQPLHLGVSLLSIAACVYMYVCRHDAKE
jgi:hypothetical protein